MAMTMIVGVVVAAMLVMHVVMIVAVRMSMIVMMMDEIARGGFISAALRLERRIDGDDLRTKACQQRLDGWIALQPDPPLQHLDRHVPVAEMPGKPRQPRQIGRPRLHQWLRLGDDFNVSAGVEQQRVVSAQPHRFGEIELHAGAFDPEQKALLRLPLRMRQDQRIDGGNALPFGGVKNASGAWHVRSDLDDAFN